MAKTFHFQADARFSAENLDDAFEKLAEHFMALAGVVAIDTGGSARTLDHLGEMSLSTPDDSAMERNH